MSNAKFDVKKFFDEGNEIASKITEDDLVEEQMFQILESNILKILNLSTQPNGFLIKLMLMSKILNEHNISSIEFDFEFLSTYLQYSKEEYHVKILSENIYPDSPTPLRDQCIAENPPEEITDNEISSEFQNTLDEKLQVLHNPADNTSSIELNDSVDEPSFNGRIYHLFEQRERIKIVFFNILHYIKVPKDAIFITALILFEMENLSANEYQQTLYYEDIYDKINPHKQWFAYLDVSLNLSKPQVFVHFNK